MFPNPQDALPLPPQPNLEQYKKLAKDLVKACKSAQAEAISAWVLQWLASLARLQGVELTPRVRASIERRAYPIEEFIRTKLNGTETETPKCALADALFLIARSHGFLSWPKFVKHLEGLTLESSPVSNFELAADAIIAGDTQTLQRLLLADPNLVRARSTREHQATLLHYVSANGVEGYRQKSSQNAAAVAELLLKSGAEVDATATVYRGACTTLELVATSTPPLLAGVQEGLIEKLLDHGADPDGAPGGQGMIIHCLANGCPQAALLLAERGARLTLDGAAALGNVAVLQKFFNDDGSMKSQAAQERLASAFVWACAYGRHDVIEFLLSKGADIGTQGNQGQTGLHWAAMNADIGTMKLLLEHGAPLEVRNTYGGTVLSQALWSAAHSSSSGDYTTVVETLIQSDAKVPERHAPVNERIDELLERHGSRADEELWWLGDPPKKKRKQ